MIQEIDSEGFSIIEHLVDESLRTVTQDENELDQIKTNLLKDLENGNLILLAGVNGDTATYGFGAFRRPLKEITSIHCPIEVWGELFSDIFQHLKEIHPVIRISGKNVPSSKHAFLTSSGFSMVEYADMSIKRADIELISQSEPPEDFQIVQYSEDMKELVAKMLFESFVGHPFTEQYQEQVGSLDACSKTLTRVNDAWHFSILTHDEDPIGSCLVKDQDGHGQVGLVAILPSFRGQGFGRTIVSHSLIDAAKVHSKMKVISLSSVNGGPAFNLYKDLGFTTNSIHQTFAWVKKE
ncbi:N-acetyltransferase [Candidatus Thorarchaeota archaeon]|nr:MAG: N-acetyltransferase [Candidatus Thorarchaeota archaeon]